MNSTLFGGRTITGVLFTDGHTEDVRVRQIPLADYERAFACRDDEFALTALCCGECAEGREQREADGPRSPPPPLPSARPAAWALTLTPESYEQLRAAAEEVNAKGFFAYAARCATREAGAQQAAISAMIQLPPDQRDRMLQFGLEQARRSTSPSSSPGSPRRPA